MTTYLGMTLIVALFLKARHPELLQRRRRTQEGAARWDRILVTLFGMVVLPGCIVVAGLDERLGLGADAPLAAYLIGEIVLVLCGVLLVRAMIVNPHFEAHVRIQEDRDHRVIATGPYRIVRHPGYVGMAGSSVAIPLILGSWWALVPGLVGFIIVVVRTALEDRFLRRKLPGYAEYAQRVRFRLAPGIW